MVFVVVPTLIVTVYFPGFVNFSDGVLVVLPATDVVLTTVIERPFGNLIEIQISEAVVVAGNTS